MVGLGGMCGFSLIHPLPGIWDGLRLDTAITLPAGVEAYGAYALDVLTVVGASSCSPGRGSGGSAWPRA